ncbi:hypothetical protein BVRB_004000 [Beta vulgaris subsp. vulgaris]|uniref:Protein TIFY n=1 Tax=Beta vulgaris subsp. vulgaris TaxID=3555 RepID=A0A0J8DYD7_BETVV|nr:protein TIFY 5A [Beta vulgaris subsp. vulgaris]KMS95890.1 hypothetical protein BVRB_004000 [Beta vulgaris subsp. vulgaris]
MDCNLQLGLFHSSTSFSSSASTISMGSNDGEIMKQEQMTIFYNGRICVCDVTELQARSIITLASKSKTSEVKSRTSIGGGDHISPTVQCQELYTQNGLSMKKSLRQFLEKRKHRIQATSPYHR